jgi:hypothetical protein
MESSILIPQRGIDVALLYQNNISDQQLTNIPLIVYRKEVVKKWVQIRSRRKTDDLQISNYNNRLREISY